MGKRIGVLALTVLLLGYLGTGVAAAVPDPAADWSPTTDWTVGTGRVADEDYLLRAEPAARAVAAEYRIPASVTAGQSILESGWGRSTLSVESQNFFGYKCVKGTPGPIAIGCRDYPTTECTPECHPTTAAFRVYNGMGDSFRDYGRLITTSPYYAAALPLAGDPDAFVTEVAKKYATDPNYAAKVIDLMRRYDLYRLDRPA